MPPGQFGGGPADIGSIRAGRANHLAVLVEAFLHGRLNVLNDLHLPAEVFRVTDCLDSHITAFQKAKACAFSLPLRGCLVAQSHGGTAKPPMSVDSREHLQRFSELLKIQLLLPESLARFGKIQDRDAQLDAFANGLQPVLALSWNQECRRQRRRLHQLQRYQQNVRPGGLAVKVARFQPGLNESRVPHPAVARKLARLLDPRRQGIVP